MDEEQHRKRIADLLRNTASSVQSSFSASEKMARPDIELMARMEAKAICLGHSVVIAHGTGESATQTMARAKDLFAQTAEWMSGKKVRK